MPKLVIIYGTGSHNTERMAQAIEEGAKAQGVETILRNACKVKLPIAAELRGITLKIKNNKDV
jgi:flavodoxin